MSNKELIELLKYCSPHIIYVVNGQNRIIKLHTPFKLLVLQDIGGLRKNQIVSCTELKITKQGRIVFLIDGKNYHTYHFDILAI
jgi:predicted component of type VI protein secretion system